MEHMHKLKALSMLENGATVSEEQWVELTGQPAYRVRAELKRIGVEKVTREVALTFIAKRNEDAVLALAAECRKAINELARNSHHLDMLIERNDELELRVKKAEQLATNVVTKAVMKKGRPSKLPNLKPSIYGNCVYLKELAEWAGVRLQTLKEKIEETPMLLDNDKIEYTKGLPAEQAVILAKGANIIAQALNLEPKK